MDVKNPMDLMNKLKQIDTKEIEKAKIIKKVLKPGMGETDYPNETKIHFKYHVSIAETGKVLDDSDELWKKPFELVTGKEFKLPYWEEGLKSMRMGEISEYFVPKASAYTYPKVTQQLRDIALRKHEDPDYRAPSSGCCGLQESGKIKTGYCDLDHLLEDPKDLKMRFEIVKVERPGDYEKDIWQMSQGEKDLTTVESHKQGNSLIKEGKYEEAKDVYAKAIGILEQKMNRCKPGSDEHKEICEKRKPLLMNYALCMLKLKEYHEVIEHTTTVLADDPDNIKALYRRGIAYCRSWCPKEANEDLLKVAQLDPTLAAVVNEELRQLVIAQKMRDKQDMAAFKGKLFG